MATIHIKEIMDYLRDRGEDDATIYGGKQEYFLEISFVDEQTTRIALNSNAVDEEYVDKVLSVDSAYGTVLIIFDKAGLLSSIEFS